MLINYSIYGINIPPESFTLLLTEAARELDVALALNIKLMEKAATERERCLTKQMQAAVEAESQKHQILETEK